MSEFPIYRKDENEASDDPVGNVIPIAVAVRARAARPHLTDENIARLLVMLDEFDTVKRHCPTARRLLEK